MGKPNFSHQALFFPLHSHGYSTEAAQVGGSGAATRGVVSDSPGGFALYGYVPVKLLFNDISK